jgi:hypothetical protein
MAGEKVLGMDLDEFLARHEQHYWHQSNRLE